MSYEFKINDGDIVRNHSNTGYVQVSGMNKLKQNSKMVLTTGIRKDGIGTGLDKIIGRSGDEEPDIVFGTPAMFLFQTRVRNGLSRFRYVQKNYLYSRRTAEEVLDDFSPVQVWAVADDPRNFRWRVDLYTMGNLPNFSLGGVTR